MNILSEANKIINERSEEKERQYGPFIECNRKAAVIASVLCGKEITTEDIYQFQIALKLARESHSHKEDNLLDLVAYIGALNNFHEGEEPKGLKSKTLGQVPASISVGGNQVSMLSYKLTPEYIWWEGLSFRDKLLNIYKYADLPESHPLSPGWKIEVSESEIVLTVLDISNIYRLFLKKTREQPLIDFKHGDKEPHELWWESKVKSGTAHETVLKYFPINYDILDLEDVKYMYNKEK